MSILDRTEDSPVKEIIMRVQDILRTIQNNFYLAFILVSVLAVFLIIGYFLIYKKFLNGDKNLSKQRVFIWFCFIGYIIMVIGVTFLNRGARMFGDINLHFLSSYREAWNSFNSTTWRFIILNIFMLVPLGILLPLLNSKFRKFKWSLAVALIMTLTIETIQLITGYGIFELDDIFNNVIGAIIGYGLVMMIITLLDNSKKKYIRSMIYMLPLIIVIVSSMAVVGIYNSKEFGNLYISHSYKVNMKNIDLSLSAKIDDESKEVFLNNNKYNISEVPIYKAKIYDKVAGEKFFNNFLKMKHIEDEIEVDPYNDMAIYWSRGELSYNMWFYFNGGNYNYRDFSSFDEGIQKVDTDKETILRHLERFDIKIPESAVFSKSDDRNEVGAFEWNVENHIDGDYITNGRLSVEYYNDDSIKGINNKITKYKKIRDVSAKSKEEACEEFKEGKFNLYGSEDVKKIDIEDISLSYMLDSKGFYQPIYKFEVKVDGEMANIYIPAI